MATLEELCALARRFASYELAPDIDPGASLFEALSDEERHRLLWLTQYEISRKTKPAQRRAMALLRSWLSPAQRLALRRSGEFQAEGSSGGRYRLRPSCGHTERLERHGRRWYAVSRFCLHDAAEELPNADIVLAHLLWLQADEPGFLAAANEHKREMEMWSGAYRRRLAEARRRRLELAAAGGPRLDALAS